MGFCFRFQGMGKWELWTEEIKDAPPIPKVSSEFSIECLYIKFTMDLLFANTISETLGKAEHADGGKCPPKRKYEAKLHEIGSVHYLIGSNAILFFS